MRSHFLPEGVRRRRSFGSASGFRQRAPTLRASRLLNASSSRTLIYYLRPRLDEPFLRHQNEPSITVSTRNTSHLLAGANDYRSVDLEELFGDVNGKQTPDAWLGLFSGRGASVKAFPRAGSSGTEATESS